jgi:hypothetical protein
MRRLLLLAVAAALLPTPVRSDDPPKTAPKIVLKSPDGKKTYNLAELVNQLQEAYNAKGLQTLAVFREPAEEAENYAVKNNLKFLWVADPKGELWKTFDAKAMPTNILIDKGGKVVRIVPGCTRDGKNAQTLSAEIARLLGTPVVQIIEPKSNPK